jgi:hypothetical protein
MRAIERLESKHVIAAAVAAGCVAIALAGGGFEPTAFAAGGLVVWALALIGLATGILPRSEPPGPAVLAGLALAGLGILTAVSLAWASDDGNAFEDVVRTFGYLGLFVLVVTASRAGEARPWLAGLAIGLAAVGAIALLGRFEPPLFGHPDAGLAADLPAVVGRLTYPIGYWNGLAAVTAAAIALLGWFAASSPSRTVRSAAVGAMPVVMLALWMTDSRGGVIAAALAYATLIGTGPLRSRLVVNLLLGLALAAILIAVAETRDALLNRPATDDATGQGHEMLAVTIAIVAAAYGLRRALDARIQAFVIPRRATLATLAVAGVGLLAVVIAADPVKQWDEFKAPPDNAAIQSGEVGLLRGGGSGRYQFWETAVDAFASAPVEGVGASGYTPYWFEHREVAIPATRAHSVVFETMAELGLLGLLLLLGFFATVAVAGVRRLRPAEPVVETGPALALLAVGFAAAAVDWTWDLPAVFGVTVVAAALLTGPATLAGGALRTSESPWPVRSRRRFAGGVVVLLVAWVSICGSALLLLSARSLDASRDAAADGDVQAAVDSANDAIDLQPWSAEPRTQLALVYEQAGDYTKAREAIAEAIERSPDDYRLHLLASRMATEDDDPAAAREALVAAHLLNPRDPEIFDEVAAS